MNFAAGLKLHQSVNLLMYCAYMFTYNLLILYKFAPWKILISVQTSVYPTLLSKVKSGNEVKGSLFQVLQQADACDTDPA